MSATRVYYFIRVTYGLMFTLMAGVSAVYRVDVVGLNPLQLVLVGTVLEAAFFSAEIPTGVVADAYSRKLSLIIGYLTIGIGFIIEGLVPQFWAILLAQVVWGIGATFLSGAETAWLTDEVGESNLANILVRGQQITVTIGILGTLLAMGIGSIDLGTGFIVAGVGCIFLGLTLIPLMRETNFTPAAADERDTWRKLKTTFKLGLDFVRKSRMLKLVLLIELFIGLSDEGIQRLSQPLLLEEFTFPTVGNLQPVVWLGILNIVMMLVAVVLLEGLRKRIENAGSSAILRNFRLYFSLGGIAIVVLATAVNFTIGAVAFMTYGLLARMAFPLYDAWVPQQVESSVRATVMSMWGQLNALGQMIGGPAIGLLATATSLRLGYGSIALLLIPVPIIVTVILQAVETRSPDS